MNKLMKPPVWKTYFLYAIILLLIFHCEEMYSQQNQVTTYEKKKAELLVQIWAKFGQDATRFVLSIVKDQSDEEVFSGMEGVKVAAVLVGYGREYAAYIWYAEELKKIQKLKTTVDFKREEIRKERYLQEFYEKTNKGSLIKNIKTAFEQWNKKGEFEEEKDYKNRLKDKSQKVFNEICANQIGKSIDYHREKLETTLLTYDLEGKFFPIVFRYNNIELQSRFYIPIEEAECLKNKWPLEYTINKYDWGFIENKLFPTIVFLHEKDLQESDVILTPDYQFKKYEVIISPENKSDITCSFDDLNIENPYLKGYTFKYSDEKIINQQKFVSYCNALDSILNNYNHKLVQNPYNVTGKRIVGDYEIENNEDIEISYKKIFSKIGSEFDSLNSGFENELKSQNPSEYYNVYYSQNPAQLEIDKREILNYFAINSKFIKSMNFQTKKNASTAYALGRNLLAAATKINLSETYDTKKDMEREKVLSMINNSTDKPYYPQVIDFVIDVNKGLKKEWAKNQQYFDNKSEFYKAYISIHYAQILIDKQKYDNE